MEFPGQAVFLFLPLFPERRPSLKRVIVVGSGFGGAASVRALRKLLGRTAEIVVVSPRPELIYYPGLIWIPTGARKPEDLRVNLTGFFR